MKTMNPGGKDRIFTQIADADRTRDVKRDIMIARKCPLMECTEDKDCHGRACDDPNNCPGAAYDGLMEILESSNPKRGQSLSNNAVCAWWKDADNEKRSACVLD